LPLARRSPPLHGAEGAAGETRYSRTPEPRGAGAFPRAKGATVRLYWEVFRHGFRRYATYRAATVAGLFTNTVFGFLRAYVLVALFAATATVGGYDLSDALTYVFLGQGMIMTVYMWSWWEIALAIRSGDIVTDLSRPFDYQSYWLAQDLGRACYHAVFRGIPPFLVGALVFDLRLPGSPLTWLLFVASVAVAVCVSFGLRFIVNLAAFWLLDYRGVGAISTACGTFLSGFVVPIAFFPGWLAAIAHALPFRGMIQVPIDVFLEKERGWALVGVLAVQLAWAAALFAAGRLLLGAARRRVVVQGG